MFDITTQGITGFTGSETSACSGIALERHAHAGHRHHDAGVAGRDDADALGPDGAARRLDAVDRAVRVAADRR